jgi:PAS domain S-box-containing protein
MKDLFARSKAVRFGLRLRGSAANDPTARTLYALMWGLLPLFTIHATIGMLLTTHDPLGVAAFVNAVLVLTPIACLILLHKGSVRPAGVVYLAGVWLAYTLIILFNGGIHHVGLAVYIALPVSAAWLFGYRAALWTAATCLVSATTMAALETFGIGPLHYFRGLPIGIWFLLLECTAMGVVPVSVVLSSLRRALGQSRESEERFRTMANAAPVMIWVSGTDKLCTFFNLRWLQFTGRRLEEELGNGWAAGVHPDDLERCRATHSRAFDARENFQTEYRLRRVDGEYRWILDGGVPRFSSGGVFEGYIGSGIDITDLKAGQEKILAAQKLESLGVMAAGVAHDFGNLLGSIFAEADLALSEIPPETPGREDVERIRTIVTSASEMVRMLMVSAGAGVDSDSTGLVDLSSLVEQTLRLLTVSITRRAVVHTSLAKDLPAVRGNAAQLRQVIMNLVTNASEALGGEQGIITVTTERAPAIASEPAGPQGEYIRLTVSDTGCGIAPEIRARIFDQFFSTKSSGRGLGLAAVHGIVRSHGGAIDVTSTPGKCTTFEVLFPSVVESEKSRHATAIVE